MSRCPTLVLLCVTWCLVTDVARAEPVRLSYSSPDNEILLPEGATGGLSFPNAGITPLTGNDSVIATKLASWSIATEAAPDAISNLPYVFKLALQNDATGESVRLSFEGTLSGTFWRTGTTLQNQFTGPTSQSVLVGDSLVTVSLTGFEAPTGYGEEFAGTISARVTLGGDDLPEIPQPVDSPEPATVVLALLGLTAAAAGQRLRRTEGSRKQTA